MADNTKIWPIFRWANGGLSDDLFTGIKNSFYYSNDMEIREDAKSIFPKPVPAYADLTKSIQVWDASSYEHNVVCATYSNTEHWWLVCTEWSIYLVEDDWTVTKLCTFVSSSTQADDVICDMEVFNGYVYVSTRTHLFYKKDEWDQPSRWTGMAEATDDSAQNYWRCTQVLQNNWWHPLYATDVKLCIWDTNTMWYITNEVYKDLDEWFVLQTWYYIRFITELWWFVRAVATNDPYGSEVLLWDKISDAPSEVIPLEWYSIIQATIYNWYLYLLSNKWLWLLNWYQYYLLKKVEWNVDTTTKNWMCVYDDKLYFIANDWVYIYWAKNKNYADVLNLWHKVEDWYNLWAIWSYKNWIMITRGWKNVAWWTDEKIRVWINDWQATTWEVQTMCYFGTSMSEIKQSAYLRVWYHLWKTSTESWDIHIYYRTEADATDDDPENWAWHPAQANDVWLSATWDMRSPFATTIKLNCRFQWIQFKFVVTNCVYIDSLTTKTKDTNLYSADLYYNTMLD